MEKAMIIRGKEFHIKYENGIVSVLPPGNITWISGQTNPKHELTDEEIEEIARETVRGLGL